MEKVKNLLFDLGNVVIEWESTRMEYSFKQLLGDQFNGTWQHFKTQSLFEKYEVGAITTNQFRNEIKEASGLNLENEAINKAWNSGLGSIETKTIDLMLKAQPEYHTMVLSNINDLHEARFNKTLLVASGHANLTSVVHEFYMSHHINERKPNLAIYQHVIENSKIDPNETLFIDDLSENLAAAEKLGFQTEQATKQNTVEVIFEKRKLL